MRCTDCDRLMLHRVGRCSTCEGIRADERAKIVAWLRRTAGGYEAPGMYLADAIERGEHDK